MYLKLLLPEVFFSSKCTKYQIPYSWEAYFSSKEKEYGKGVEGGEGRGEEERGEGKGTGRRPPPLWILDTPMAVLALYHGALSTDTLSIYAWALICFTNTVIRLHQ